AGARLFSTAGSSQAIVTADLNNDGFTDLVVASGVAVSVLLGNGDGTFQIAKNYLFRNPNSVAVADFNGDGKLDIAVSDSGNAVMMMFGAGDGNFRPAINASAQTGTMAVGDFNGDGKPDLALSGIPAYLLINKGDGTFGAPVAPPGTQSAGM